MSDAFVHPTALVEDAAELGADTRVWHHAQVRTRAKIGERCIVGKGAFVGKISKAQIAEIATKKRPDLNCSSVEAASAMIEGSARSMGLEVVG